MRQNEAGEQQAAAALQMPMRPGPPQRRDCQQEQRHEAGRQMRPGRQQRAADEAREQAVHGPLAPPCGPFVERLSILR